MSINDDETIWKALSDPTRRTILDLLKIAPRTTGDLCGQFDDLSRCAVMKHIGVLEEAKLVLVKREGRFRWNYLNPIPIQQIYDRWISHHVQPLAATLTGLKRHVESKGKQR